jgi:hypothetical protein
MPTLERDLFRKYLHFAENLQKELVATYGKRKARRLFQKMDRARFQALCEAASTNSAKRHWLDRLEPGYTRVLVGGKKREVA